MIIVTNPEVTSVRDADRVIGLLEADGQIPANLIINRFKADLVRRNEMLDSDTVVDLLAIDLIGIVPEDEKILTAGYQGQPVALDERSQAGSAFRNIGRRLSGEDVPFEALQKQTFFQRLFGSH